MKQYLYLVAIIVSIFPIAVSAHIGGLPYFVVNGIYAATYAVPSISVPGLVLPQDDGPQRYEVNKPIDFLFDTKILQIPADVLTKTTFTWDFGDGSSLASGIKNVHTYTKPGSYILSIKMTTKDEPVLPQDIESIVIHVVPAMDYELPHAAFALNGKMQTDPINQDTLKFRPNTDIVFDASKSQVGNSPLVTYQWNFGDGSPLAVGQQVHHAYAAEKVVAAPILRVTDANGLFSDAFAEIEFRSDAPLSNVPEKKSGLVLPNSTGTNKITNIPPPNGIPWLLIGRDLFFGTIGIAIVLLVARMVLRNKK